MLVKIQVSSVVAGVVLPIGKQAARGATSAISAAPLALSEIPRAAPAPNGYIVSPCVLSPF